LWTSDSCRDIARPSCFIFFAAMAEPASALPERRRTPSPELASGTPELDVIRDAANSTRRRGPYIVHRMTEPARLVDPAGAERIMQMIARESVPMLGGHDIRESYWGSRPDYLSKLSEWTVAEHDGRLAAWCGVCRWDSPLGPILYADTLGVMPGHRRSKIGTLLVFEAWLRHWGFRGPMPIITIRTQSAVVYAMLLRYTPHLCYPRLPDLNVEIPPRIVVALDHTFRMTSPEKEFDPRTCVVKAAVNGSLYGDNPPRSGDPRVDDFFSNEMDLIAGDSIIAAVDFNAGMLVRALVAWTYVRGQLTFRRISDARKRAGA
jgi:hypothetical protein